MKGVTRTGFRRLFGGLGTPLGSYDRTSETASDQGTATRPTKLTRREELVNVLEFEPQAKLKLEAGVFATIAGSDRAAFDRMTFRPRMLTPTLDLDLGVELFGEQYFTPIIVGPVAEQRQFHADGELATVRGASAARAAMIVSSRSSVPVREIAAQAGTTPLWYSVHADASARTEIEQAIAAGCKVICITTAASGTAGSRADRTGINWKAVEATRRTRDIPMVLKGVMTPQDAKTAIEVGLAGIVVSDHGAVASGRNAPIDALASIVDVSAGKAAVLVDGNFRRGSDIAKALALGAQGVLLARPVMWGLAAYGADGVQSVIEMLQSDLGRSMGALGAPNLKSFTRDFVRIHARASR